MNDFRQGRLADEKLVVSVEASYIASNGDNKPGFLLPSDKLGNFFNRLEQYMHPALHKLPLFAFEFGPRCISDGIFCQDGWSIFNTEEEFHRQNIFTNGWRLTKLNSDYKMSPTYPSLLAVPCGVTDDLLAKCAPFRTKARFPTLSWLHPESKASLVRSSQPRVGLTESRCEEDEELIRLIKTANANANSMLIYDARPKANAIANKAKGGGCENPANYKDVQYKFLNIKNIHAMRASYLRVFDLCSEPIDEESWLRRVAESQWLHNIKHVIFAATSVADKIDSHKTSVLVHCSDGWDRTSQITSLAMLMLDPFYRTLRGFQILIEKEWCSFGHMFALRTGTPVNDFASVPATTKQQPVTGSGSSSDVNKPTVNGSSSTDQHKNGEDERSPIFLQFIDCVWQLLQQFPHSFEFNERLLITILDELYAARFGTFLCNCERQARELDVKSSTVSIWSFINSDPSYYQNPFYTPAEVSGYRVLFPQHSLAKLEFWTRYYLKWNPCMQYQEPVSKRDRELIEVMRKFRQFNKSNQRSDNVVDASPTNVVGSGSEGSRLSLASS